MVNIITRAVTIPLVIILFDCRGSFVDFVYNGVVTITKRRESDKALQRHVCYITATETIRVRKNTRPLSGNAHVITHDGYTWMRMHRYTHTPMYGAPLNRTQTHTRATTVASKKKIVIDNIIMCKLTVGA